VVARLALLAGLPIGKALMNQTEFTNLLKTTNAAQKSNPSNIQTLQAALLNELSTRLTWLSANPALFDYPNGTVVSNAATGNTASTVFDTGKHQIANTIAVRITTTVGATPTATFDIQGSNDQSTWASLNFADSSTPGTVASATFTVTTATTLVKFVQQAQRFRYLRVNVTSNTNVTFTIDVTQF
jgi:hypothetical protein